MSNPSFWFLDLMSIQTSMPNDRTDQEIASAVDELSRLQLLVARRADEIARDSTISTPLNLHCWLVAESEVFGTTVFQTSRDAVGNPNCA
jgi:hypothetical protein